MNFSIRQHAAAPCEQVPVVATYFANAPKHIRGVDHTETRFRFEPLTLIARVMGLVFAPPMKQTIREQGGGHRPPPNS